MHITSLGVVEYEPTWQAMQQFTAQRHSDTADEIWLCEHPPVFTQGRHGKSEHIIAPGKIPVVNTDRGGQVTYHCPGQLIAYLLVDLKRRKIGIKDFVKKVEQSIQATLQDYDIDTTLKTNAPGVYVNDAKLASIGLRVKHGRTYHGISINVDMDLSPFKRINPCGYQGMPMTDIAKQTNQHLSTLEIGQVFVAHLRDRLPAQDAR